ncbi:hypothetical protein COO91_08413 [Nostoc flagelliforme CCNUN1]|uniref:Uncharacterized protein n=1 Tax=Nostoc flagelliforme CCNUN1 TaxID=2038116 RepID=A0A2K8T3J9_9NOSO|nr:hypothetical protein COO91_08413 [Nostoc flagelliforme CCNUN1]
MSNTLNFFGDSDNDSHVGYAKYEKVFNVAIATCLIAIASISKA